MTGPDCGAAPSPATMTTTDLVARRRALETGIMAELDATPGKPLGWVLASVVRRDRLGGDLADVRAELRRREAER